MLLLINRNSHFKSILRLYFSHSISNKLSPLGRASVLSHFIHDFVQANYLRLYSGFWAGIACVPLGFLLLAFPGAEPLPCEGAGKRAFEAPVFLV